MQMRIADTKANANGAVRRKIVDSLRHDDTVLVVLCTHGKRLAPKHSHAIGTLVDEARHAMLPTDPLPPLRVGDVMMDRERHEVRRDNRVVPLSPMEYSLLEFLLLHRDRVIREAQLVLLVLGSRDPRRGHNALWVHMHRLRRKLETAGSAPVIDTVKGVGYILKSPEPASA